MGYSSWVCKESDVTERLSAYEYILSTREIPNIHVICTLLPGILKFICSFKAGPLLKCQHFLF